MTDSAYLRHGSRRVRFHATHNDDVLGAEFRELFDLYFDYVCRSLRRLGVSERDLDDLAQEVFVRVYERLSDFNPSDDPRAWLFSFATRIAANYRRLSRHKRELLRTDEVGDSASPRSNPEQDVLRKQSLELILQALESIPFERRTVFIMHDIDQVSGPTIAKSMMIPVNTVYSRLRIARSEFKDAVSRIQKRTK